MKIPALIMAIALLSSPANAVCVQGGSCDNGPTDIVYSWTSQTFLTLPEAVTFIGLIDTEVCQQSAKIVPTFFSKKSLLIQNYSVVYCEPIGGAIAE